MGTISIQKIAELAGVSKTTVSFVLNGRGDEKNISKATQTKINDIAKANHYQANHIARSLSLGKSFTIGFIVPDISNPFYGKIARYVERFAEHKGYSVMVASTDENIEKEQKIVAQFKARQVDGIILASSAPDYTSLQNTIPAGLPCISFDRVYKNQQQSFVDINNEQSAYQLSQNLIEKGHKRIAIFVLTAYLPNIKQRIDGYKLALKENGLEYDSNLQIEISFKDKKEQINKAIESLINTKEAPTAMLFVNNVLATEALWQVNTNYPKLKNKLLFACFDNLELFDYSVPKVISALQPNTEIAEKCVSMLCNQIESNEMSDGIQVKTEIIDR